MHPSSFDRLTKRIRGISRRDLARALLFAVTAIPLTPVRIAHAQSGTVPPGGACADTLECQQDDMRGQMICADNGFTADGPFTCCAEEGCCASDADCCGDLRCAPTGDVCSICLSPPFPTRGLGQLCDADADCVPSVTCEVACLSRRCACPGAPEVTDAPDRPDLPDIPDAESAMAFAAWLSLLESSERYDILYRAMHPDAKAIVPAEVMTLWFRRLAPTRGAEAAVPLKVRFISWTWGVTGKTYPDAAEVAFRQQLWNGTIVRDEVRLAKDQFGNWGWFFGRDRAFVEEQIARFG